MRLKLENTDEFTTVAKASSVFAERFKLVDCPSNSCSILRFLIITSSSYRWTSMMTMEDHNENYYDNSEVRDNLRQDKVVTS